MEKKKKHHSAWYNPKLGRWLVGVMLCIVIILCCLSSYIVYVFAAPEIEARFEIYQMRFWELPQGSEFVSFEMRSTGGGTAGWIEGTLTVSTILSENEIREFYLNHYNPRCFIDATPLGVEMIGQPQNGLTFYEICNVWQFD
jgi:hypothetical protein